MTKILQKEAPILRQKAEVVPQSLFGTVKLRKIVKDMKIALHKEYDGVGLAATQIGIPYRIFIVASKVIESNKSSGALMTDEQKEKDNNWLNDLVFINPKLIKVSRDKKLEEEGCLSVRPLYGQVKRASRATVRALDENGEVFTRGASGLLAQIFQHEMDHLEGILFIDKAANLREIPRNEMVIHK